MRKKMIFTAILVTFTLLLLNGCKTTEATEDPADNDQIQVAVAAIQPVQETTASENATAPEETSAPKETAAPEKATTNTEKIAIRVNCGFEGDAYTDQDGKVWQPDRIMADDLDWGAMDGQIIQRPTLDIKGTKCPDIYKSETYSMTAYKFKVPKGKYTVTLHFAETYDGISGEGQRVFSVSINGKEVLKDLDPYKEAGAFATPVVKKFNGIEPVDGAITIGFTPSIENPQICGIEVVSEGSAETPTETEKFALRVDCGNYDNSYTDKAGNIWQADQDKSDTNKWGAVYGSVISRPGLNIPDTNCPIIYESERYSMDAYVFEVPNGKYTVTLHFAETFEGIYGVGERVFSVAINGKEVLKNFDPYKDAGEFNTPSVKKFKGIEPVDGKIEVSFTPGVENPQINGIEIISE